MNPATAHQTLNTEILGNAPVFQAATRAARLIAATDTSVLILGESGTGKELIAKLIHQLSRRAHLPLVTVNCAALPAELVESELFGHKRGAFTGAHEQREGFIAQADQGTLFLDEIGELPLAAQAKLLRFLDYGEIQPIGCSTTERVNVRVLAATNRDLAAMIKQGLFRADLYYRLQMIPIELPALRQRQEDIAPLTNAFVKRFCHKHKVAEPHFTADAWQSLNNYHWPGNVRELRNLIERSVILFNGREMNAALLQQWMQQPEISKTESWQLPIQGLCLESLEMNLIRQALQQSTGNKTQAAKLLGLTRDTLLYRLKKYALS